MAVVVRKGRFMALYLTTEGRQRSAGTFPGRKHAVAGYHLAMRGQAVPKLVYPRAVRGAKTVAEYAETWLPGKRLEPNTREHWQSTLTKHILPDLGVRVLAKVTRADLQRWFNGLEAGGMSAATLQAVKVVVSSMMSAALDEAEITVNPITGVRVKPNPARRRHIISPQEFRLLLEHAPDHYRLLLRTLVGSGLRWGECTDLSWPDDFDLDGAVILVNHTVQETSGPVFTRKDYPKGVSTRSVPIAEELAADIRGAMPGLLFTQPNGTRLTRSYFRNRIWQRTLKRATLPRTYRPHDLRHAHASWLLAGGCDLVSAQRRLGHSSIRTTQRYLDELPSASDVALAALNKTMNG